MGEELAGTNDVASFKCCRACEHARILADDVARTAQLVVTQGVLSHALRDVDETLLARAGLVRRKRNPGRAWIGAVRFAADRRSARVTAPTTAGSPAYDAGIDQEDEIVAVDAEPTASVEALDQILRRHRPGDRLRVSIRRRGASEDVTVIATEDPRLEILPIESAGGHLTAEQRAFRDAWLGSKIR